MAGSRRPYQRAASSRSQSTSGCFSSKCIRNPSLHLVKIVGIHGLSERGVVAQFVSSAQYFPVSRLGEFGPQNLRFVCIEPIGKSAPILWRETNHTPLKLL